MLTFFLWLILLLLCWPLALLALLLYPLLWLILLPFRLALGGGDAAGQYPAPAERRAGRGALMGGPCEHNYEHL